MAARLPVVVSQSIRREPRSVSCEENLITELLFTQGLDATLIGPLESIQIGSTDHLCLEGLKGPFALLSWGSVREVASQLARLSIQGGLADRDDNQVTIVEIKAPGVEGIDRRIDHYQLRTETLPSVWIDQIKQTLQSRDVKAFQIRMPTKITDSKPMVALKSDLPKAIIEKVVAKLVAKTTDFSKVVDLDQDEDEAWEHLDLLMDDLDQSNV